MNVVSTFRPHRGEPEYAMNQVRAVHSWQGIFDRVYLLGDPEPELSYPNVFFVASRDFPHIRDMIEILGDQPGWGVWINCDIVLTARIKDVLIRLEQTQKNAATSQRWTFDPKTYDLPHARIETNDFGLDIFMARQPYWQHMFTVIPPNLRKGGQVYDTWMTGYFWNRCGHSYCSFTHWRCVFHPRHGGRRAEAYNDPAWIQDQYGRSACIPPPLD